jgi:hypothetical protein
MPPKKVVEDVKKRRLTALLQKYVSSPEPYLCIHSSFKVLGVFV